MEKWHQHLGVYGIHTKESKLLVVKKSRGPYMNRYDLPGGSFNNNESIVTCLKRELSEEVGFDFYPEHLIGTYDYLVPWLSENNSTHVHHMAIYYRVSTENDIKDNMRIADDTSGFEYIDINQLNINNASPLVLDVLSYLRGEVMELSLKRFDDWTVLRKSVF